MEYLPVTGAAGADLASVPPLRLEPAEGVNPWLNGP
jgi:hypothetical protein